MFKFRTNPSKSQEQSCIEMRVFNRICVGETFFLQIGKDKDVGIQTKTRIQRMFGACLIYGWKLAFKFCFIKCMYLYLYYENLATERGTWREREDI